MRVFCTTASPYPTYSFTGIVEILDLKMQPGEEIRIRRGRETYMLSRINKQNGNVQNFMLTSNNGTTIEPEDTGAYVLASDESVIWARPHETGVQIGGGTKGECVLISKPTILTDVITMKGFAKKGDPNITQRITVGALYDPAQGHILDRTVHFLFTKENGRAPIILIDFDNDVELKKSYARIVSDLRLGPLDISTEEAILKKVFDEFNNTKYLDNEKLLGRLRSLNGGIKVGPLIKRLGGTCAYQAIAVSAVIERLIKDGHLNGKVFWGNAKRHGWPLYLSLENILYVIDSTQHKLVNLNAFPETKFKGIEERDGKEVYKYFNYIDYLPAEITE